MKKIIAIASLLISLTVFAEAVLPVGEAGSTVNSKGEPYSAAAIAKMAESCQKCADEMKRANSLARAHAASIAAKKEADDKNQKVTPGQARTLGQ